MIGSAFSENLSLKREKADKKTVCLENMGFSNIGQAGRHLAQAVTLACPFLIYLHTMCPTVYSLDSAELTAAAYVLGLVHAPGYPLYLLLGKLFTYLPWGDVGWRVNVMSAVWATLTVWLLYRILVHYTESVLLAAASALFFAFTYYFWTAALVAEVYTLQTCLLALLLLILITWERRQDHRLLYFFSWLYGLSLSNHASALLLVFGFVFFLFSAGRQALKPKIVALMVACFLLGLSVYLYLPLRYLASPRFNYAGEFDADGVFHPLNLTNIQDLLWFVSGRMFASAMFAYDLGGFAYELGRALVGLWGNLVAVGVAPGLLGALWLFRHRRRHFGLLALLWLAHFLFFVNYRVVDKSTMFLPVYLIWAIWMGLGYRAILDWVVGKSSESPVEGSQVLQAVLMVLFFVTFLLPLAVNYRYADVSDDRRARELGETILQEIEPDAIFLGHWATAAPLSYLQVVENQRPDVLVINLFLISPPTLERLVERQITRRPIYAEHENRRLEERYRFVELSWGYKLQVDKDR